jgi:hypothetical protein
VANMADEDAVLRPRDDPMKVWVGYRLSDGRLVPAMHIRHPSSPGFDWREAAPSLEAFLQETQAGGIVAQPRLMGGGSQLLWVWRRSECWTFPHLRALARKRPNRALRPIWEVGGSGCFPAPSMPLKPMPRQGLAVSLPANS